MNQRTPAVRYAPCTVTNTVSTPRMTVKIFSSKVSINPPMLHVFCTDADAETKLKLPPSEETELKRVSGHVCAIMTRARRREQTALEESQRKNVPNALDISPVVLVTPVKVSNRQRRRTRQKEKIQKALEPWSNEFLAEQQSTNTDLVQVHTWLESGNKPAWEYVRGDSPSLKAYWQQLDSLQIIAGVLHRKVELLNGPEPVCQLLLPRSL